jgi:hypothetical protein
MEWQCHLADVEMLKMRNIDAAHAKSNLRSLWDKRAPPSRA